MTTEILTPASLTFEHIKGWDGQTMRKYLAMPEMRSVIYGLIQNRTLPEIEALPSAQPIPEVAPVPPVVPVVAPVVPVQEPPKKIVLEYQVKDEEGNPLGRPTHLEAFTYEELVEKMRVCHTEATRAFHRLKKQKFTPKPVETTPVSVGMSDQDLLAAMKDIRSEDPTKALDAQKRITKSEVDKQLSKEREALRLQQEAARAQHASLTFLKNHINDFNNCEANNIVLRDYILENELDWTVDNLELAFTAKELELAPVVKPVAPVNPPPVVPTIVAAPTVAQPVVPAPAPVVPAVNPTSAQPRPGVNGSLIPGDTSAIRPAAVATGVTIEEIRSWDAPTMRLKMRNPALRAQIEKALADRTQNRSI